MAERIARSTFWRMTSMVGLALVVTACAELTGSSSPSGLFPSSIGQFFHPDPAAPDTPASASSIPPPGAVRYRRILMQAWQYHFAFAEDPAIGFGQVHQESRFDCSAVSPSGSAGCAQFMPGTAAWINNLIPAAVRATCPSRSGCPMDPLWALTAMVEYDWRLWGANKWAANNRERWAFALAAYNGGGAVTGGERTACQSNSGCSHTRYFDHVERFCGSTGRSAASCRENRLYPRIILDRWTPAYRAWLRS
jgi:hypothetical protein